LIDSGFPGGRDSGRIHKIVREVAGLKKIDHHIVTHLHQDHYGGTAELAELLPVDTLWENGIESAPERERNDRRLAPFRTAKVGRRVVVKPGTELPLRQVRGSAALSFRFVAARQELAPVPTKAKTKVAPSHAGACEKAGRRAPDKSDNANSIAMKLSLGSFDYFNGGDLTWNVEGELVCPDNRIGGPVDVYQTSHHGVDDSNNSAMLATLAPTVAVFNNGPRKGGGAITFATLKEMPSVKAIYQVHRDLVHPASNTDAELIANDEDPCAGAYLRMTVDPTGKRYTLINPSKKHEKTYASEATRRRR
jgi:hypothetical protein